MKVNVEKTIEVDVTLSKEEWETIYNAFNILEDINNKVTESGLDDDCCFTIATATNDYSSRKCFSSDNELLSELISRYDEFLV